MTISKHGFSPTPSASPETTENPSHRTPERSAIRSAIVRQVRVLRRTLRDAESRPRSAAVASDCSPTVTRDDPDVVTWAPGMWSPSAVLAAATESFERLSHAVVAGAVLDVSASERAG